LLVDGTHIVGVVIGIDSHEITMEHRNVDSLQAQNTTMMDKALIVFLDAVMHHAMETPLCIATCLSFNAQQSNSEAQCHHSLSTSCISAPSLHVYYDWPRFAASSTSPYQ